MGKRGRQVVDLLGKKFGKLAVMSLSCINHNGAQWACDCDCGHKGKVIHGGNLTTGKITSCGCLQRELTSKRNWKGIGNLSGRFWADIQRQARNRGLQFTVSIQEAWTLFEKQKGKCALSGVDIVLTKNQKNQTASLDRIDSYQGYTFENIQWVHKKLNRMKSDLELSEFNEWCTLVCTHLQSQL